MIALAAVGVGGVGFGLYSIRPRDPVFEVQAITLSGFNLRFCTDSPLLLAVVDVSLTLFIKVINPNVTPIQFSSTIMDIYYKGTLLGQAQVCACFVCFRCYCYCRCCFCLRLARLIGFGAALCIWIIALYFVLFICSRWRIVHVWETFWTRHMFQMRIIHVWETFRIRHMFRIIFSLFALYELCLCLVIGLHPTTITLRKIETNAPPPACSAVAKSIVNVTISALTVEKTLSRGHL